MVIGAPGKSNAFAISEKLGLPKDIVNNANRRISIEEKRFERVISQLENERVEMEKNREAAQKLKAEYEAKYKKYGEELERKQKEPVFSKTSDPVDEFSYKEVIDEWLNGKKN